MRVMLDRSRNIKVGAFVVCDFRGMMAEQIPIVCSLIELQKAVVPERDAKDGMADIDQCLNALAS